jgi:hypothetical protein
MLAAEALVHIVTIMKAMESAITLVPQAQTTVLWVELVVAVVADVAMEIILLAVEKGLLEQMVLAAEAAVAVPTGTVKLMAIPVAAE